MTDLNRPKQTFSDPGSETQTFSDPVRPTQREIDEARDYIRRRLDCQHIAEGELIREFDEAAEAIALIVLKYMARGTRLRFYGTSAMAREIEEVLSKLKGKMESLFSRYGTPDDGEMMRSEEALVYAIGEDHGATFEEREELYLEGLRKSVKGIDFLALGMDEEELTEAIMESSEKVRNRLLLLLTNTIAVGWMQYQFLEARDRGKTGFWVVNGSAPCEYCRDYAGFHPMTDRTPPLHPHCVCIAVYV